MIPGISAQQPVREPEHAAFIQSGVSIVPASRDTANAPKLARAAGCRVSPDRRRVTMLLAAPQAAALLSAIRATGAVAVVFTQPEHASLV